MKSHNIAFHPNCLPVFDLMFSNHELNQKPDGSRKPLLGLEVSVKLIDSGLLEDVVEALVNACTEPRYPDRNNQMLRKSLYDILVGRPSEEWRITQVGCKEGFVVFTMTDRNGTSWKMVVHGANFPRTNVRLHFTALHDELSLSLYMPGRLIAFYEGRSGTERFDLRCELNERNHTWYLSDHAVTGY